MLIKFKFKNNIIKPTEEREGVVNVSQGMQWLSLTPDKLLVRKRFLH